jgi:hypothetical protein
MGDTDSALYYSREAGERTKEWQAEMNQLPQPQFTQQELEYMRQRPDLVANPQAVNFYADYIQRNMGVPRTLPASTDGEAPRSNPQFLELMSHVVEPTGYQPLPTPDDIVHELQTNSRYANLGGKFSPRDYNRGVATLIEAKKRGFYPDKQ